MGLDRWRLVGLDCGDWWVSRWVAWWLCFFFFFFVVVVVVVAGVRGKGMLGVLKNGVLILVGFWWAVGNGGVVGMVVLWWWLSCLVVERGTEAGIREIIDSSSGPRHLSTILLKNFDLFKIAESVINFCLKFFSN